MFRPAFASALVAAFHVLTPCALASPNGAPTSVIIDEGFAQVDDPLAGIYVNDWVRVDASELPLVGAYRGHGWHTTGFAPFTAYDAPALSMLVPADPSEIPPSGTVSVWLLSPPVEFGPSFSVSFMARSFRGVADWAGVDRLQVRLCTGNDCGHPGLSSDDPGDFTRLLLDINADEEEDGFPNAWTRYTADAADGIPVMGVGRIAFRYFVHQAGNSKAAGLLGLDRVVVASTPSHEGGLSLALHASLYDPAEDQTCTGSNTIAATRGDTIDLCYEVANTSSETLRYHSLRDDAVGPLLTSEEEDLPPGSVRTFHRQVTVTGHRAISATATSIAEPRDYSIDPNQPYRYLDIHASAPTIASGSIVDMPFAFEFYGRPVSRFCVREDATFAIVNAEHCPSQTVGAMPTSDGEWVSNSPFAAVYAERFWPNIGHVFMTIAGTAPSRELVIQWYQKVPLTVPPASIDPAMGLDAELILHEGSNQIEFLYRNTRFGGPRGNDDGGNASIGLQKDLRGIRVGYHEPVLDSVRRVVFSPTRPASKVDTQTAVVDALVPAIALSMASVDTSAPSHGIGTRTVDIANTGAGRLDWRTALGSPAIMPSTEPERPFYTFDLWNTNMGSGYGPLIRFSPEHTNYEAPDGAIELAVLNNRSIYAAAFVDDDFTTLYAIDSDTRELMRWTGVDQPGAVAGYTIVGTVPLLIDPITGIRQDPTTGVTWLTTSNGATSALWRLDLRTASVDAVGEIAGAVDVDDIAFDTTGQLYGIDEEADTLLSIDKTTATATAVGSLGINAAHSSALDFDASTATMYLITFDQGGSSLYNQLFTVDRTSGIATALSDVVGADSALPIALWETLAIARRSGACTVPEAMPWVHVSTNAGSTPAGGSTRITLTFDGTSLPDGLYQANLCLYSNDPMRSRISVPLSFALGADAIFAADFER